MPKEANLDPALLAKEHLSLDEASKLLGVFRSTVHNWARRGWVKYKYRQPDDKWGLLVETRSLLVYWYYVYIPREHGYIKLPMQSPSEDIDYDDDL
jgi:hypothetical protein